MNLTISSAPIKAICIIPGIAALIPNYDISRPLHSVARGDEKWIMCHGGVIKEEEEQTEFNTSGFYRQFLDIEFFIAHINPKLCYYINRDKGTYHGPYKNASIFSYHKYAMVITVDDEFAWIDRKFNIIDPTAIHTLEGHSGAYHYVSNTHEYKGMTISDSSFGNEYFIEAEPFSDKGFAFVTTKKNKSKMAMDINGVKYRMSQMGDNGLPKSFRYK